ncbi:hypothetical protein AB6A40_000860 [Gnathostoma spinigerum]|uniref:ATPase AAA-type core domain-containing protein n=1 Tax=Gnathostoma spinigerum TaxID=75299 RepID=A0ABD6E466_9BILA
MKPSSSEMHSLSHVDRLCFIFACDHLPKIHVIKANHDGSRPKICEENHSCLSNFGEDVETSAILQCQEKLVNACAKYLSYCLFNNGGSLRNALVIGKNFSGKSTLIRRLSKKMFRSSIVYSSYIEGLKWKGRSADNVLKALQLEIGRLVKRYPSVLFIDDIDFFEEVEDKSDTNVERIFAGLKRIAEENNIQVVATAKNVHAIHKSSLTSNPKRFFGRTFTIEELNLVNHLKL